MKARAWGLATLLAAAALASGGAAWAHHSFAMYDVDKVVPLSGTVTAFEWANPHVHLRLVVVGDTGQSTEWNIEAQSPDNLMRHGWRRDSVHPGDKVDLLIHPMRDGSTGGSLARASINGHPIGGGRA